MEALEQQGTQNLVQHVEKKCNEPQLFLIIKAFSLTVVLVALAPFVMWQSCVNLCYIANGVIILLTWMIILNTCLETPTIWGKKCSLRNMLVGRSWLWMQTKMPSKHLTRWMSITAWRWNGALGGGMGNGNASWNNSIQLNQIHTYFPSHYFIHMFFPIKADGFHIWGGEWTWIEQFNIFWVKQRFWNAFEATFFNCI